MRPSTDESDSRRLCWPYCVTARNAAGDYLTTEGQSPGDDIEVIERAGLEPNAGTNDFDPEAVKSRSGDDSSVDTAAGTATSNTDD
jgi:hypothetical protein